MRWLHIIDDTEPMEPRTGLFLVRPYAYDSGAWWGATLVLAFTGRKKRLFFVNYEQGVAKARPRWWVRISFRRARRWDRYFTAYAGVSPLILGLTTPKRQITLYEEAE